MMIETTKTSLIELEIERQIDKGITDLQEIYTFVCDKFGVPRTTVRRIKKELVEKLKKKFKVLDSLTSKRTVKTSVGSDPDNLTHLEKRILELLQSKKGAIKFRFIYEILNFDTHYTKVSKKTVSYRLRKLVAANLLKHKGESRYIIVRKRK